MRPARAAFALASSTGVLLASTGVARAESHLGDLRVDYAAPTACPNEAAFRSRLETRIREAPDDRAGRPLHALTIRVAVRNRGYAGELRVRDADDAESVRTVDAATCDELVDALAFLSALSMGIVMREPSPKPPPPPASTPPSPLPGRAAGAGAADRAALEPSSSHVAFSFGAGAATSSFVGPTVGVGVGAFVEVRREASALFAPALRLSGSRVEGAATGAAGGVASFTLTALRLDACPVRVRPASAVSVAPCLGARAGALRGDANAIARAHSDAEAWVSADLLARVQWSPLSEWIALEGELGGSVPIFRYDFSFLPDASLYRVPVVGWVSGVGLAVRFP